MSPIPYLRKMAKGGDAEALSCLRKMADEGDADAGNALNEINPDGNGAGPDDALPQFGKSEDAAMGDLFELGNLDAAIDNAEPFAKSEDAGDIGPAEDTLMGQPEVAAAVQMDAGDFVKALVGGVAEQLDQVGNTVLWNANGVEALAKAQIAQGESIHAIAGGLDELRKSLDGLTSLLTNRGAGIQGVGAGQTRPAAPTQPLNKAFDRDAGGSAPANPFAERDTLRKSLRAMRDAADPGSQRHAQVRAALDDLTVNNLEPARALVAAG